MLLVNQSKRTDGQSNLKCRSLAVIRIYCSGRILIRDYVEELKLHDMEVDDEELGRKVDR